MTNNTNLPDITPDTVHLRRATQADVGGLVALMNRCYRSPEGLTHEAELIGGIRTTADEVSRMLNNEQLYLFVLPNPDNDSEILDCISVDFTPVDGKPAAYIGTFSVIPELQGRGIGNVLLSAVETFITRHSQSRGVSHFSMSILSHRPELLAYYQRRGYALTGEKMPFPYDGNNGEPKRDDLFLEFLQKPIVLN